MAAESLDHLRRALAAGTPLAAALHATLAPLREYDRLHNGDLVHSLDVYFEVGENLSRAAGLLFLHRNSLYYRLAHIQALTGLPLDDETARVWLHLAVLAERFQAEDEEDGNEREGDTGPA